MNQLAMDEEDSVFAIRRSTQDKLTYKNIIAQAINKCNNSKGTVRFKDDVQALASTISFDVSGYNLATKLINIREELKNGIVVFIDKKEKQLGRKLLFHANQAKLKILIYEWYWNNYYEAILQLLAAHNLLFDTERKISVIQDNKTYDAEE